jgi:hypothetical protein
VSFNGDEGSLDSKNGAAIGFCEHGFFDQN